MLTGRPAELDPFTPQASFYLDTASIGLVPRTSAAAVSTCYRALEGGVRGFGALQDEEERVAHLFADEFGVQATDVSFPSNTGQAINGIAQAVEWRPGDEVVLLADDFPSVRLPWTALPSGVVLRQVAVGRDGDRTEALLGAVCERTRVVCASHVDSASGATIDLDRVGRACAGVGSLFVVDGAQSAGCLGVDLRWVDFFIATGYKWLLGGFGIAVLIGKSISRAALRPRLRGHANPPPSTSLAYSFTNPAGIYALGAAADLRRSIGIDAIHGRVLYLARRLHEGLAELALPAQPGVTELAGIVTVGCIDAPRTVARLAEAGLVATSRADRLRLSTHFYVSEGAIDRTLEILGAASRSSPLQESK